MRALRSLALLAIVGVVAAGCHKASEGPAASGSQAKSLRVVYIPKNTGNPYFDEVVRGFKDACTEMHADFFTTGPTTADATSQIPIINEQVQRGVDVIAISPNSPDALNQVLDDARKKGIAVITVDADLVGNETHRDAAVLPTDFSKVGPSQLDLLGKLVGFKGDFAILSATTDAPNQNVWIAGMKAALSGPKYSQMKLVDIVYGDDEPQKSTNEAEALLAKYPNLSGIISPTSVGLAAAAQTLKLAGNYPGGPHAKGAGIQLTGLSTPNQLAPFVKDGVVTAFQLWAPYNEGYLAAYIGAKIKDGSLKPAAGASFDTPKLGKREFSPKLEVTGGPLVTFDKSNVNQYNF